MNPLQQQELLSKLDKQNAQAGFDTTETVIPPVQPTQPVQATTAQPVQPVQPVQPAVGPGQAMEIPVQSMQPSDHMPEPTPTQPVYAQEHTEIQKEDNTVETRKDRIEALEAALGNVPKVTNELTAKARVYVDDFGSETYYVKNVSNGHVAVSDIDVTVQRGKSEDLLKFASLEDIKKSRDLRAAISYDKKPNPYKRSLLLRLTPEEYETEKTKELQNKQKIDQFKQNQANVHAQHQQTQQQTQAHNGITQQSITQPQTPRIRPTVLSKLEKLRLSSVPESAHLGLAPEEFVEWAVTENLSIEELDFVISHPNVINNTNIRTALYEKRSEMT